MKRVFTIKYFFLFLIFLLTNEVFSQWSNDPSNNLIIGYGLNPELCSDSTGGCYVTYDYGSLNYPQKLAVERLDKYGYKPWGDKKQILGELEEQWLAEIVEDGEGGVIISYLDDTIVWPNFTYRVRVQRVDSAGNFLWGQTGVRVTTTEINHGDQAITSDGNGGCIVVWPNQLPNFTYEFRANRINNLGVRTWSDTGIFLENNINSDPARIIRVSDGNYYVQIRRNLYRISENGEIIRRDSVTLGNIIPDQAGGLVLSGKTGTINNIKLVAQRNDSLGNNLWQEPYIEIDDSLYYPDPKLMVLKNDNYFYFTWMGNKYGVTRVAQFQSLRLDGSKLFPEGSISISNRTPLSVAGIIPSESTKTIFVWNDDPNLADTTLAQNYDTLGNKIWDENGIVIAHPAFSDIGYTIDQNGGFIIGGTINDFTIVAQQVSKYGKLGEVITSIPQEYQETIPTEIVLYQNYANPFNSSTTIKYELPEEGLVTLKVYDVLGNEVASLVNEVKQSGYYSIEFNASDLSSGIYFYRLNTGNFSSTKKFLLLK